MRATERSRSPDDQPADSFALDGDWTVQTQYATPTTAAGGGIRLDFHASEVRMVLAGTGDVRVRLDGGAERIVHVSGTPRSYAVVERGHDGRGVLDVTVPPGVEVYSFTFG